MKNRMKTSICRKCYNKEIHIRPCHGIEIEFKNNKYDWCKPEPKEELVNKVQDGEFINTTTKDNIKLKQLYSPL